MHNPVKTLCQTAAIIGILIPFAWVAIGIFYNPNNDPPQHLNPYANLPKSERIAYAEREEARLKEKRRAAAQMYGKAELINKIERLRAGWVTHE